MKNLKKFMFIIMIFILIIITILIFLLKDTENNNERNISIDDGEEIVPEKDKNGYVEVEDINIFYSVVNSLNHCIDNMKYSENMNIDDESENSIRNLEIVYEMLDKNYIDKNKIDLDNIETYIYQTNDNTIIIPEQMKVKYQKNINVYILKTYFVSDNSEEKYFIVRTDNKNQSYSIEFVNYKVNNIEEVKVEENDNKIEKNDYNNFEIEMINDGQILQNYLEHYKNMAIYYPEITYNEYLDEEYREKRFGALENYKKYITDNIEFMQSIRATKYLVEEDENGARSYACMDQYENIYLFNISSMLKYRIKLDTYTLKNDKFISEYNNVDNQNKVKMNINKIINMLNSRDYNSIYKLIDENFRNNNFNSIDAFEKYIKNRFPAYYEAKYKTFEAIGDNIFTQELLLKDVSDSGLEDLNLVIIMKLEEGINFSISFNIK